MENPDKNNYKLSNFFISFFDNFGKMFITNLLFNIPLIIFGGIVILISYLMGYINIFIVFLLIPIMSPFFAGLTYVCKKLTIKQKIQPAKDFFKGVKENFKYFIVNGLIFYVVAVGLWITFNFYRDNLEQPIIIAALVFSIIFGLYFLFMEFLIPTMSVSVELKFIQILKNAVVLTLAGFINNLKTLISFMLVFSVIFTMFQLLGNPIINVIIIGLLVIILLPVFCTYIVTFNSYQTIEKYVINPYIKEHIAEKQQEQKENAVAEIDIDELSELAQGNPDEFVFLNGRMLKRSAIQKMLEKRLNTKTDSRE